MENSNTTGISLTTITPFLVVKNAATAIEFYINGLGANEIERYEMGNGKMGATLAINGAQFFIGDEEQEFNNLSPHAIGGSPVRIILTVADPHTLFAKAVKAGATEICPVTTEESWQIGKLKDPFGHIWEIGHPLTQG